MRHPTLNGLDDRLRRLSSGDAGGVLHRKGTAFLKRFLSKCGQMGRDHHIVHIQQGVVRRGWFLFQDIETCSENLLLLQGSDQSSLVDHRTAAASCNCAAC